VRTTCEGLIDDPPDDVVEPKTGVEKSIIAEKKPAANVFI
jgi:hypothetical protein